MTVAYCADPDRLIAKFRADLNAMAQAGMNGSEDPTALLLAMMKVKSANNQQALQGANPPTVAQEVMGGLPPAPPAPPSLPAGGLGASPQGMPPMAPQMPAPPMGEAPVGMAAGGGLDALPIPDTMFDEPSNGGFDDGYAGGGLVAFADGGGVDAERLRRALLMQESSGDYGAVNKGSGAMGGYQFMPDTARAIAARLGLPYRPELMTGSGGRSAEGKAYQEKLMDAQMQDILAFSKGDVGRAGIYHFAGPNQKGWGPKTRQYERDILRRYSGGKDETTLPERDIESPQGRRMSFEDQEAIAQERFGKLPEGGLGELEAYYRGELDPEAQRKARKDDMWMALAQIGASMASSKSPYFLQAAGEAIAATLPSVSAGKKERKDAERDARLGLREVLGLRRKEQVDVLEYAKDLHAIEMGAETSEIERRERREAAEEARAHDVSMAGISHTQAMERIRAQGQIANSQFEQLAAARKAQLKDRLAQGLPITDPDGNPVRSRSGRMAESELNTLANMWALYDTNRYRASNAGGGDLAETLKLKPGGAGAAPAGGVHLGTIGE